MKDVYIPCKLPGGLGRPGIIETADGWVHEVTLGQIDLVDGKFCLIGQHVAERDGIHLIRFDDHSEAWVFPAREWKYEPYPRPGLAA